MKKYYVILCLLLIYISGSAQSTNGFSYQAVVRDAGGHTIANKQVSLRISILQGDSLGTVVYSEEFSPTTNAFGLVNLNIGSSHPEEFKLINWSRRPYFIKVELDPEGGYNYILSGISQLLSVPYALYAEKAGSQNETDPLFQQWDKSSGIQISASQVSDINEINTYVKSELNNTQRGAGLKGDGSYKPNQEANYISDATSLKDADLRLDTALKVTADKLALEIVDRISAITSEQTERIAAINAVRAKIKNDSTFLKGLINKEIDDRKNAVDTEEAARIAADDDIRAEMNSANSNLQTALDNETANRETAMSGEAAARNNADASMQTELDNSQTGAGLAENGNYIQNESVNYIKAATSLNDADVKLDAQVKTNADNLATEVSNRETTVNNEATARSSADDALHTELDNSQTGAGLAENGNYIQNESANYIKAATSLNDADVKLDAQVKTNADNLATEISNRGKAISDEATTRAGADESIRSDMNSINSELQSAISTETSNRIQVDSNLQKELNDSQTGAGLADNGTYSKNEAANYISEAASLNDADVKLDTQVKTNATDLADEISNRETAINNEATTRAGEDESIRSDMNSRDSDLQSAIKTETSNREQADTDLNNEMDASQTGAGLADNGTYSKNEAANYISEAASLNDADVKLDAQVKTNADNLATETSKRETAVNDEKTARAEADESIRSDMNSINSDLQSALSTESSNREQADFDLQKELNDSQTGAGLADNGTYSKNEAANYISEAASLNDADVKLDAQVKTNADNLATEISNRGKAISDEATTRAGADDALQTELNNSQSGAGLAENGNYIQNESANYIKAATSLNDADIKLDAQVKTNADNLATEISNRGKAISDEATTRAGADDALQTELNNSQSGAGLAENGNYIQNESANYIKAATSLNNADIKLDAQVKTNADKLTAEIADRATAVNNEATTRTEADDALQTELNNSQSGAGLAENGNYIQNESANYIKAATSLNDADVKLDAQVKTNADNLATEISSRETDVNSEETARISADNALHNELDASQTGAGLADNGNYTKNTSANYIATATSLNNADVKLDNQIKINETAIALNTSKVTNATHTGDVSGAITLTIGDYKVLDRHINWGTEANQVSTADIPEQTNLFYTDARVAANTNVASNTSKLNTIAGTATADKAVVLDASKNIAGLNNVSASTVSATKVTGSNFQTDGYIYFGNPNTNGTWRMKPSTEGLLFECRESGVWIEKMTILK